MVEPPRTSGFPRLREFVRVGAENDQRIDLRLYKPTLAFGKVLNPHGEPLADVTINFYSSELTLDGLPLLVGIAYTSDNGEFVVPLPTPTR